MPKEVKVYIYQGVEYTLPQLCKHFGFKYQTVKRYVNQKGMPIEDVLNYCARTPQTWGVFEPSPRKKKTK